MSEENVKRKVLSVLSVEHQGILPRVTGLFSRRGFNIDSIIACKTEDPGLARWTLVVTGDEATFTQLMRQLLKLEDVIKVEALEMENCSNSELLLIKVRTGPAGRAGLLRTAQTYGGRVLDVGDCTMTLEPVSYTHLARFCCSPLLKCHYSIVLLSIQHRCQNHPSD